MNFNQNIFERALLPLPSWGPKPAILEISAHLVMPFNYRPGTFTSGMELVFPLIQACNFNKHEKKLYKRVNFVCTEIYCEEDTASELQLDEFGLGIMYDVQIEFMRLAYTLKTSSSLHKSKALLD